jgi:hypothetical protein
MRPAAMNNSVVADGFRWAAALAVILAAPLPSIQVANAASAGAQQTVSDRTKVEPGDDIAGGETRPAPTSSSPLKQASVAVDFGDPQGYLLRTERLNTWDNGDPAPNLRADDVAFLNEQGLHAEVTRVGLSLEGLCDVADEASECRGEGGDTLCDVATDSCDFSSIADWLSDISDATDSLMVHLTPRSIIQAKRPPSEAIPLLTLTIRELKRQFPKIDYIESSNEPDWVFHGSQVYAKKEPILQPGELYAYYVPFYKAVNAVNAQLPPWKHLKVGGPTLTGMNETWMTAFLDGYAADPNPDKRLDFISYHGYGVFSDAFAYHVFKSDPSQAGAQRPRLEAWLRARHLSENIPVFITETGIYPGGSVDDPDPSKADYLRQAAGLASLHYWWAESPRTYPFNWVVRHGAQGRKDQLVTRAPGGPQADTFTPYGNMLVMQSKMKDLRVKATSDSLTDGQGVYAVASKDKSGASIMVWNYQSTNNARFRTSIAMSRLPSALRKGPVRRTLYRIDQTTSNYWADPQRANLQQVGEKYISPATAYHETVDLEPNALYLILLEPVAPSSAPD